MKERPILFSAPMVRALLDGSKTQTRRIVKLPHQNPLGVWEPTTIGGPNGGRTRAGQTIPEQGAIWHTRTGDTLGSPYGWPGDRLWVREAWRAPPSLDHRPPRDIDPALAACVRYEAEGEPSTMLWGRLRASMHMPRWASRITLEVTDVRVERLSDISEADAVAEGCAAKHTADADYTARAAYRCLWESINGGGSWDADPWVWCVSFKRVESPFSGSAPSAATDSHQS